MLKFSQKKKEKKISDRSVFSVSPQQHLALSETPAEPVHYHLAELSKWSIKHFVCEQSFG